MTTTDTEFRRRHPLWRPRWLLLRWVGLRGQRRLAWLGVVLLGAGPVLLSLSLLWYVRSGALAERLEGTLSRLLGGPVSIQGLRVVGWKQYEVARVTWWADGMSEPLLRGEDAFLSCDPYEGWEVSFSRATVDLSSDESLARWAGLLRSRAGVATPLSSRPSSPPQTSSSRATRAYTPDKRPSTRSIAQGALSGVEGRNLPVALRLTASSARVLGWSRHSRLAHSAVESIPPLGQPVRTVETSEASLPQPLGPEWPTIRGELTLSSLSRRASLVARSSDGGRQSLLALETPGGFRVTLSPRPLLAGEERLSDLLGWPLMLLPRDLSGELTSSDDGDGPRAHLRARGTLDLRELSRKLELPEASGLVELALDLRRGRGVGRGRASGGIGVRLAGEPVRLGGLALELYCFVLTGELFREALAEGQVTVEELALSVTVEGQQVSIEGTGEEGMLLRARWGDGGTVELREPVGTTVEALTHRVRVARTWQSHDSYEGSGP